MTKTDACGWVESEEGTIVFFLGAGCSADCGAPVMSGFIEEANRLARRDNPLFDDYETLFQFRDECRKISDGMRRCWDNVEDLLTQAHFRSLSGDKDADEIIRSMTRVVWDVYRRPRYVPDQTCGYSLFGKAILQRARQWVNKRGPRPVIMTTNYDIHLEERFGFDKRNPLALYPFYPGLDLTLDDLPEDRDVFPPRTEQRYNVEVLKLHGSANWYRCENLEQVDRNRTSERLEDVAKMPMFDCQTNAWADRVKSGSHEPLIVPPLFSRIGEERIIRRQLQRAAHAVASALEISIIGYSFPETDAVISSLLAFGIGKSRYLKKLSIVNAAQYNDGYWDRVKAMFSEPWFENHAEVKSCTFHEFVEDMEFEPR